MKCIFLSTVSCLYVVMVVGISEEYKAFFLNAHNDLRREIALGKTPNQPEAANMVEMVWDDKLAVRADEWAKQCIARHDTYDDRTVDKYDLVGQNFYAVGNVKIVVQGWYDEYKDFTFEGKSCSTICGHYTQVAWAKSYAVGCAAVNCKEKASGAFPYGFMFVCNYGPGGNRDEETLYAVGPACSQCPKGTSCKNSLCALNDPNGVLEFPEENSEEKKKRSLYLK